MSWKQSGKQSLINTFLVLSYDFPLRPMCLPYKEKEALQESAVAYGFQFLQTLEGRELCVKGHHILLAFLLCSD